MKPAGVPNDRMLTLEFQYHQATARIARV